MHSAPRYRFIWLNSGRVWPRLLLSCALAVCGAIAASSQSPSPTQLPLVDGARGAAEAAPAQWISRLNDGKLSPEEIASGTALALHAQSDNATKWDHGWGDFVELAHKAGKLPDNLWRDYLLGAVRIRIRVGNAAKRSGGLQIWIDYESARTGGYGPPGKVIGIREDDLSGIPIKGVKAVRSSRMNLSSNGGGGVFLTEDLTQERYAALKPGPQTYHYRYLLWVTDEKAGGASPDHPPAQRIIEGELPWQLLAEDAAPLLPEMRANPALRPAIEKALHGAYIMRDENDKTLAEIMIQVDHPPTPMAFEMSLRNGDDVWPLGPVGWADDRPSWWAFDVDLPEDIKQVDMVLLPSAQAAAAISNDWRHGFLDVKTVWDGPQIVIPRVEVRTQRITMIKVKQPTPEAAREYALAQMSPFDPVVELIKRDGNITTARAQLEKKRKEHADDIMAAYGLGCVLMADNDLTGAMKQFVEAVQLNPEKSLRRQIQRQQRRLCAMWLTAAESGDAASMTALGAAYEHGWGAGSEIQEAKRWYRSASNGGNADAMCRLAALYENKTGATIHTARADEWYRLQTLDWYRKSAGLGNQEAKQWITAHNQ